MSHPARPWPPEAMPVPPRSLPMTPPSPTILSLADVAARLEHHPELSPDRRRDLRSAIMRVSDVLQTPPALLPASLAELRPRLDRVAPAAHGLSLKTWQNIRSNLIAAIKLVTTPGSRRTALRAPAWQHLRDLLPNKRMQNG